MSFFSTAQTCFWCSFLAFAFCLLPFCLNLHLNLCQCPWGSRVLVSVRSCLAIGALNFKWFSKLWCELSDPCGSFETFLTHSRHTFSNGFSLGQLYQNTSVNSSPASLDQTSRAAWPKPMHHSLSRLHAQYFWLVRQCLLQVVRTAPFVH